LREAGIPVYGLGVLGRDADHGLGPLADIIRACRLELLGFLA